MRRPNGCAWNGDCDNCGWSFCIATAQQALKFYHREEKETEKRFGRGLARHKGARSKLTPEEKAGIMQAIRDGESLDSIAERYDIVRETARNYKKIVNKVSGKTDNSKGA